jgi:hypothetical protein
MDKVKQIVNEIEAWLGTFSVQNSKSDFRGCRSTLRILDRLYEKLDNQIQDDLKLEARGQHYKPMSQL